MNVDAPFLGRQEAAGRVVRLLCVHSTTFVLAVVASLLVGCAEGHLRDTLSRASNYERTGWYSKCVDEYLLAIGLLKQSEREDQNTEMAQALEGLAKCEETLGQRENAIRSLQQAIREREKGPRIDHSTVSYDWFRIIKLYEQMQRYDEAIDAATAKIRASRSDLDRASGLNLRAQLRRKRAAAQGTTKDLSLADADDAEAVPIIEAMERRRRREAEYKAWSDDYDRAERIREREKASSRTGGRNSSRGRGRSDLDDEDADTMPNERARNVEPRPPTRVPNPPPRTRAEYGTSGGPENLVCGKKFCVCPPGQHPFCCFPEYPDRAWCACTDGTVAPGC
jgi:tetratricopeptide (TPR) repeat protein